MFVSRDHILNVNDKKTEKVFCPDWGGDVLVTVMSGLDRDAFEVDRFTKKTPDAAVNMRNFRAALACKCCVDPNGQRLFKDEDAEALGQKSGLMLDLIYDAAARLNGLRQSDVEKLTKNSESDRKDDSTSPSPSVSVAQ